MDALDQKETPHAKESHEVKIQYEYIHTYNSSKKKNITLLSLPLFSLCYYYNVHN